LRLGPNITMDPGDAGPTLGLLSASVLGLIRHVMNIWLGRPRVPIRALDFALVPRLIRLPLLRRHAAYVTLTFTRKIQLLLLSLLTYIPGGWGLP
jgi:hypothetical protein